MTQLSIGANSLAWVIGVPQMMNNLISAGSIPRSLGRRLAESQRIEERRVRKVDMDELLSISDIVSIHIPLNESTRHLINKELISRMNDNVVVINTSRGPIIAQDALIDALKSRKILAAGLDVFESEPIDCINEEILKLNNVVLTSHVAGHSLESFADLHRKFAETACKVLEGEFPANIVNRELITK